MDLTLSTAAMLLGLLFAAPEATQPVEVPPRVELAGASSTAQFTAGIEEPVLYELIAAVADRQPPTRETGRIYSRHELFGKPQAFVGELLLIDGEFIETQAVQVVDAPEPLPALIWSTILLDSSREPIQVLTLDRPTGIGRRNKVSVTGYFYKIRQDRAQEAAAPATSPAIVHVPVLVGWLRPGRSGLPATAARQGGSEWTIAGLAAAALAAFFIVAVLSRRRVEWHARLSRGRSWRHRRDGMRSENRNGNSLDHGQQ